MQILTSLRPRIVEVVSYPTPNETIMVRMVPGEPTTVKKVYVAELTPCKRKYRYVYLARVIGFTFPEDMVFYDNAALYDHRLPECGEENPILGYADGLRVPDEGLIVYKLSSAKRVKPWTYGRWQSYSCWIEEVKVTDLRKQESV
jgi:hypothetical protein